MTSPEPASRPWLHREALLVLASLAAGFILLELGCRIQAWLTHRRSFERAMREPPPLPKDGSASLGNLLRPSFDPRLVYELRPDLSVRLVVPTAPAVAVRTSRQGFRDVEYPVAKPKDAYRIIGVGDSLMFGWGVEQGRDYLAVLEERLRREHPGRSWEVINTAVPGYNTAMEAEALAAKGLAYRPDLVVVGYCANDYGLPNFIWPDEPYLSLRTSLLKRFVGERLGRWKAPPPPNVFGSGMQNAPLNGTFFEEDPQRVPVRYRDMVGFEGLARGLGRLRDLGREHGFGVAVLAFFDGPDARGEAVAAEVERLGLHLVDVGPAQERYMRANGIANYYASALTVGPEDPHPSMTSHAIAAEVLLEWMRAQGLVGS